MGTPSHMVSLTTTPRQTSTLLNLGMPTVLLAALTLFPSLTAGSRLSPTLLTTPMAMLPRCPTLERPSTPLPPLVVTLVRPRLTRPLPMLRLCTTLLHLHTTHKPSLCSVNIYQIIY